MTDKLLEIKNLSVVYETDEAIVHAINGLDLTINKGETLGLVGETGAGKTTTALSIMKLLPGKTGIIKNGEIKLEDINITKATKQDMRLLRGNIISMIFQDPMTSLNPTLTVSYQIAEVLALHKKNMKKEELSKKVDEILEMVGLPPSRKNEYPHQFSGGMKQRVVIAIALACEPKLLLADEPTTALDVTIQAQILKLMKELKEKIDTSMLLITHDLGVVAEICDKVAIMYAGQVIEIGSIDDIFESKHHHPYTTGLFGAIPDLSKKTKRLNPVEGLMPDPTDLPTGCYFHVRCSKCMDKCKTEEPAARWANKERTHSIKCHLFNDIDTI